MSKQPVIIWFRNDLRLADHAALRAAARAAPVVPVFILDDEAAGDWSAGAASLWWLHHSLTALHGDLVDRGAQLVRRRGDTVKALTDIAEDLDAGAVYFSRAYEPWAREQESAVCEALEPQLAVRRYPGALLAEPETIATQSGDPYKVYTPFWKTLKAQLGEQPPKPEPDSVDWYGRKLKSDDHADWNLLPVKPDWAGGLRETWAAGEKAAHRQLQSFALKAAPDYDEMRNRPDVDGTSRLSPHLHYGELSPRQVWHAVTEQVVDGDLAQDAATSFLREIAWREFSSHLLFHFPTLPEENFRGQFDRFPWCDNAQALSDWQRGQTGYPIVDAGMRQLWHTGWMHNRVRMIVASFLIKHLRLHWRHGEDWFWDTLVDADLANNAAGWQWVAGSGADASPYFRIFNPITQGEKFDPDGEYVRRWVPELADLPNKYLNRPWEAPAEVLAAAGVSLGQSYPEPLVDHAQAREAALAGYQQTRD